MEKDIIISIDVGGTTFESSILNKNCLDIIAISEKWHVGDYSTSQELFDAINSQINDLLNIKTIDKKMIVSELYENSPAAKSGLFPGDEILKIDNIQINNKALQEVGSLLKGPSGTAILLTIERQNKKVEINIIREDIQIPAVSFVKKINKNTGIIKLNTFTNTASSEFKKGLKSLIEQNIENLIIDLRSNGGGLLNEAVKIVSLFVSKGELVVSTKLTAGI